MGFVNIHGEAVDLGRLGTPKRGRTAKVAEPSHKGFRVVGISREQVDEARASHEKESALRIQSGMQPLPPFDIDQWARNAKSKRISLKPFATMDGARSCVDVAERTGWIKVTIEPLAKGG